MTSKLNANDFKLIYMTLKKAFITRIVLQVFMRKHAFTGTSKSMHCQKINHLLRTYATVETTSLTSL